MSGRIVGQTQTVTLYVDQEYNNIDQPGAYAAATVLALIAIVALLLTKLLHPRAGRIAEPNAAAPVIAQSDAVRASSKESS